MGRWLMDTIWIACQEKTRHGNAFRSRKACRRKCDYIRQANGLFLKPYRCPSCGLWHMTTDIERTQRHHLRKVKAQLKEMKK